MVVRPTREGVELFEITQSHSFKWEFVNARRVLGDNVWLTASCGQTLKVI